MERHSPSRLHPAADPRQNLKDQVLRRNFSPGSKWHANCRAAKPATRSSSLGCAAEPSPSLIRSFHTAAGKNSR